MNTALKNLINTLKRYRLSSILNITGLAVAFAAFLVIVMQIKHERTFDQVHTKANRIFRVDRPRDVVDAFSAVIPRAFADVVISSSPHIKEGALINVSTGLTYFTVGEESNKKGFMEQFVTCYPNIVKIFDFVLVEGDLSCLEDPEKVLLPESIAKKMFGNESAVGKIIQTDENLWTKEHVNAFTVGGVFKDFPENTQLNNKIYTAMDKTGQDDFYSQNFVAYILLDSPESRKGVEDNFNSTFDFKAYESSELTRLELTPLTDIYYKPHQLSDIFKTGDPDTSKLLLLIALLVIVIACINFINFSTSLAPVRMKSINIQKVLGSSVMSLRRMLIFEAVGMSVIAYLIACLIVWVLNQTQSLSFITADIELQAHAPLLFFMLIISALLGLAAGCYPAWYMTSFPPALVLKGSFGLTPSGRRLRTILIGLQYVISTGLIIGAIFVQLQNNYIRTYDAGFKKEHIAIVDIGSNIYSKSGEVFKQKLTKYPGIEDVAFSVQRIGAFDTYKSFGMKYKGETFYSYIIEVSPNFLRVMDIPIVDGRDFMESDIRNDSVPVYIYNQNLQKQIGLVGGEYLDPDWNGRGLVAGFTADIKLTSLRQGEDYVAFVVNPRQSLPISYIRLKEGADITASIEHIRQSVAEIDPSYPFNIAFYDTFFGMLYKKEESLNKMISAFSLLAIILSLAGILGLVIFETQYRKKEIGVRKVFGATTQSVLMMFNTIYFRIIIVCFIIAMPIAFIFVNKWLESFVYRTPIYWWVFALAFIIISLITFVTVSIQSWKAATANPVDSIKTE